MASDKKAKQDLSKTVKKKRSRCQIQSIQTYRHETQASKKVDDLLLLIQKSQQDQTEKENRLSSNRFSNRMTYTINKTKVQSQLKSPLMTQMTTKGRPYEEDIYYATRRLAYP